MVDFLNFLELRTGKYKRRIDYSNNKSNNVNEF
jgi:hypothetical protein